MTGAEAPENKSRKIWQEGTVAGCSSCTEGLAFPAEEAEAGARENSPSATSSGLGGSEELSELQNTADD